tara:strand:- start:30048 stop:30638 length:591 start_codon:yes stop_codon:yes gene_type:complete
MNKDESELYRNQLVKARDCANTNNIRYNSNLNLIETVSDINLQVVKKLIQDFLTEDMSKNLVGYWGVNCMDISANIYIFLHKLGIPCEIVFGDIEMGEVRKYRVEVEPLIEEHKNEKNKGAQTVHVWITLGDDIIIDGSLYDMTVVEMNCPKLWNSRIIVTRASGIYLMKQIRYIPMFLGAGFLSTTNAYSPSLFF